MHCRAAVRRPERTPQRGLHVRVRTLRSLRFMAFTNSTDSADTERTVSVLPHKNFLWERDTQRCESRGLACDVHARLVRHLVWPDS
jgi:hypothetical protein